MSPAGIRVGAEPSTGPGLMMTVITLHSRGDSVGVRTHAWKSFEEAYLGNSEYQHTDTQLFCVNKPIHNGILWKKRKEVESVRGRL